MRRIALIVAAGLLVHAAPASAATWRDVGPDGGNVRAVDGSAAHGLIALGRTAAAWRPPGASPWRPCAPLPPRAVALEERRFGPVAPALAVDPATGDPFIALGDRLVRGNAACSSWREIVFRDADGRLAVSGIARVGSSLLALAGGSLRSSADGGRTWSPAGAGLAPTAAGASLTAEPGGVVLVRADGGARLACSTDAGATFRETQLGRVDGAARAPDGSIVASSAGRLLASSDGCATFTRVAAPAGAVGPRIAGADGTATWIADASRRLWRRTPDGTTTELVTADAIDAVIAGPDGDGPIAIGERLLRLPGGTPEAIDAGLHLYEGVGLLSARRGATLVTVIPGAIDRVRVSTDGGATWAARRAPTALGSVGLLPSGRLLATSADFTQELVSDDAAQTWQPAASGAPFLLFEPYVTDPGGSLRTWRFPAFTGVARSNDGGTTFVATGRLRPGSSIVGAAVPRSARLLVARVGTSGTALRLIASANDGRSWRALPTAGLPARDPDAASPRVAGGGGALYVLDQERLFRLGPGATRWRPFDQGLEPQWLPPGTTIAVERSHGAVIVARTDGVWRRSPTAGRFAMVPGSPRQAEVIATVPAGTLIAGVERMAILEGAP